MASFKPSTTQNDTRTQLNSDKGLTSNNNAVSSSSKDSKLDTTASTAKQNSAAVKKKTRWSNINNSTITNDSQKPQRKGHNRVRHSQHFSQQQHHKAALSGRERAKTEKNLNLLLRGLIGHLTVVELRNESMAAGKIVNVDGFMNISMSETTFRKVNGQETEFEQFFIVGKNIRFVHIPDHLDIMTVIQRELTKISKSRLGTPIGRGRGRGRGKAANPNFMPIGSKSGLANKTSTASNSPLVQNKNSELSTPKLTAAKDEAK